ncbi:MAG TPA: O-antigen ligase family protein [Xanthomonadaceae bacterium]|nr:O-antigen ligase family protein [Xanthomonadaceae bacterium]
MKRHGWLLLLAVLVLLPIGRMAELPLLLAALGGLWLLIREPRALWADRRVHLACGLFIAYWLPQLLSAFGAVDPGKAWTEVAADLRFLPFAIFAIAVLPDAATLQRLLTGSALILGLWLADAVVQMLSGFSFGGPATADRLSGIFGADNLKLGPVLATLAPLLLWPCGRRFGVPATLALAIVLLAAIMLAGSRAAWVSYALVLLALIWRSAPSALLALRNGILVTLAVGVMMLTAYQGSERFALRMDRTAALLAGTAEDVDTALAGRLPIWRTALVMAAANPVSGVGVRGFRRAYPEYAAADDPWVGWNGDPGEGAFHAHQIVLEIIAETGFLGLALWLWGAWLAIVAWSRSHAEVRRDAFPVALALAVMVFPINTHLAFYSSFWGLTLWWLLALYVAALRRP